MGQIVSPPAAGLGYGLIAAYFDPFAVTLDSTDPNLTVANFTAAGTGPGDWYISGTPYDNKVIAIVGTPQTIQDYTVVATPNYSGINLAYISTMLAGVSTKLRVSLLIAHM